MKINDLDVRIFYRSEDFPKLFNTFQIALSSHLKWLGQFPFPSLVIIESSELQRADLPGIVTLNKPRQTLFRTLQYNLLNWSHWAAVALLANQWLANPLYTSHPRDLWFYRGTVDFLTLQALRENKSRFNLFNIFDLNFTTLSVNYEESQNITAALLGKYDPTGVLTNDELQTATPAAKQHPLLFIRHTMALRHLHHLAGKGAFRRFLTAFSYRFRYDKLEPPDFARFITTVPSPFSGLKRRDLSQVLQRWWTLPGWPDFSFEDLQGTRLPDGRWIADVELTQQGPFRFPVEVAVIDHMNRRSMTTARPDPATPGRIKASLVTRGEPRVVHVDPDHHIFDSNRFDNGSEAPDVAFFPGNTNTLKDQTYTLVWLPYLSRRAGENLSLGIHGNLFRFINSELTGRYEIEHKSYRQGFYLEFLRPLTDSGMTAHMTARQNFDAHRFLSLRLRQSPLLDTGVRASGYVRVREKRIVGLGATTHGTLSLGLQIKPGFLDQRCGYKMAAEYEATPPSWAPGIEYHRLTAVAQAHCQLWSVLDWSARFFAGDLYSRSTVPENVLFAPEDLHEAHLRVDMENLPPVNRIRAVSTDLYLPFAIPFPGDTLILGRQLRWHVFYDAGRDLDMNRHLEAAGAGIIMPFGGDFTGAGSLTLTRMSLLVVLHSRVGGEINRKPRVLFDITGAL